MSQSWHIDIAGLSIPLRRPSDALAQLQGIYRTFQDRQSAFVADDRNPHLCRAGCSHCCRSGAVFSVTLVEAVQWSLAIEALPGGARRHVQELARELFRRQHNEFGQVEGAPDVPGRRDDVLFSKRLSKLNAAHPACPLLIDDLCSVYHARPMLCRAYGFPVDAYAVQSDDAIVFRSLCVLYEGMQLSDYVRATELKEQLVELSRRLADGHDWGRFTSPETILSQVRR